jgi:hypothetical protein
MMEQPPIQPTPVGALRFNTDSAKLEYFDGNQYVNITLDSPQQNTGGTRGLWGGGGPSATDRIDFVNVDTAGNATDFGNLVGNENYTRGYGNRTRGLWAQSVGPVSNEIEFVTIASTGDAQDFGDLTQNSQSGCHTGDSTRCCFFQGRNPTENVISFVTIASTGNAVDFGDMLQGVRHTCAVQSPTRGIVPGGWTNQPSGGNTSIIQYITTSTLGNASDFGDVSISESIRGHAAGSNAVRGVYGGGTRYPNGVQNGLEFITMATLGNGKEFGDLTYTGRQEGGGCASGTRAVFGGAYSPSAVNTMNYVQIMTTGNGVDFGDLTIARGTGALSNGHGGLG